jgi:hypothetical protein
MSPEVVNDEGEVPPEPLEAFVHELRRRQLSEVLLLKYQSVALVFRLKKLNKTINTVKFNFIIRKLK